MNGNNTEVKLSDEQIEKALTNEGVILKFADKIKAVLGIEKKEGKKPEKKADDDGTVKLSAAEYDQLKADMNELKVKLIEKDKQQLNFSDSLVKLKEDARKEKAEALCSRAQNNGIPTAFIERVKPILMSDMSEKTIKLSHMVDDKKVEADISLFELVRDLFDNYPGGKIEMSDKTSTDIVPPSGDKMKKVTARKNELMAQGKTEFDALTIAGQELL